MNIDDFFVMLFGVLVGLAIGGTWACRCSRGWIFQDCREQGPDYIRQNKGRKLLKMIIIAIVACFAGMMIDVVFLTRAGILLDAFRTVLKHEGAPGWVTWRLWVGMTAGSVGGCALGQWAAFRSVPKCKGLYR